LECLAGVSGRAGASKEVEFPREIPARRPKIEKTFLFPPLLLYKKPRFSEDDFYAAQNATRKTFFPMRIDKLRLETERRLLPKFFVS
jgi:hypothetical protein